MRKVTRSLRSKYNLIQWHNSHFHYMFSYHKLFLSRLIFRGRKAQAFRWVADIKYQLKLREEFDPYLLMFVALLKIAPNVILFPIKKSGVVQGAPFPISRRKQITFALTWVVKLLKDNHRVVSVSKMVELLEGALYDRGDAIGKKTAVHARAFVNKHLVKFYR